MLGLAHVPVHPIANITSDRPRTNSLQWCCLNHSNHFGNYCFWYTSDRDRWCYR